MNDLFKVKGNWGQVVQLTAGFDVYDKEGGSIIATRTWEARSYVRNFARLVRAIFNAVEPTLTNQGTGSFAASTTSNPAGETTRLVPRASVNTGTPIPRGIGYTGAMVGIGTGAALEDMSRVNFVVEYRTVDARLSVSLLEESSTNYSFQVAQGITISDSAGITVSEIGLFARVRDNDGSGTNKNAEVVLVAYDGVSPGIFVPQGGVIAPKYTLSFPV